MNRTPIAAVAAVALLLLTGCTSTAQSGPATSEAIAASPTPAESAASAAPLTAEKPTDATSAAGTPQEAFLVKIREVLPDDTSIPNATDDQLLTAAGEACAQMAAGTDSTLVSVIAGEQQDAAGYYQDSARIAAVARQTICP